MGAIASKDSAALPLDLPKSFYDIVETKNNGEEFHFSELKGKVIYGLLTLKA